MQEEVPPYLDNSGSDGSQVVGSESSDMPIPSTMGLPLEVIAYTARSNPREFGRGSFPGSILASMFFEKSKDLESANEKIEKLEAKLESKVEELSQSDKKVTRYSERLRNFKKSEIRIQIFNVVAAAFIGVAVDLYKSGFTSIAYILGAGSLLVLLSPFLDFILTPKDENEPT